MSKSRDLETLTAHMQKKQSWGDIEETLKNQPRIRLPDRRALALWGSFELARFRGSNEDWEDWEDRKRDVQQRQAEVVQTARNGDSNMVDLGYVAEALDAHSRRMDMMDGHHRQMAENDRQQREGMHYENRLAMEQMARNQREAEERARMAAEVTRIHVDRGAADRDRMNAAIAAAGLQQPNVTNVYNTHHHAHSTDASVHNTHHHAHNTDASTHHTDASVHSVTNNTLNEKSIHNQVQLLLHTDSAQVAEYARMHHMSEQRMLQLMTEHVRRTQTPQQPLIMYMPGGGGGPPPSPGSGAVAIPNAKRKNLSLHIIPHQPPPPEVVAAHTKPPPPPPPAGAAMAAAEPMIPIVAQAPERIQEPVKAKGSRARTHTPRPVQPRAKSKPKTPTRAHTPPPAPKSQSEIDMTDPTVEPQPPKKRAQSAGSENETPQLDSSKKPRANSRKPKEQPETPVPREAPKRGRSTSRTAEIQVIPVPKSSRAASSRKKAKNPTDGAGPELAKALTEH